jgi:sugar/nucleoside kinase (ribokinase family)
MCREFSAADLDEDLLRTSGYLYFTGYMWDTEVQKGAIQRAISICRQAGITVVFDLADPFAVDRYRDDFLTLLEGSVDIVFANRKEAELLFGCTTPEECARQLGRRVALATVKLGKAGSVVVHNGTPTAVAARPITATDSTGAGDMFAAGFLAAWTHNQDAPAAAGAAGYLAEEIIQRTGAQFSIQEITTIRNTMQNKGMIS